MVIESQYSAQRIHRQMLRDSVRCEAYRTAIRRSITPGDVVLDFGAGTGLLSVFAAQAGARKVYAVERTPIAEFARTLIERNGLADLIEVIQADIQDVELRESVDVLISEWMGGYGVDENLLAPLLVARDRWLRPGGLIVPERVTAYLAPVFVEWLEKDRARWRARPYGVDLGPVADARADEIYYGQHDIGLDQLRSGPEVMWITETATESVERAHEPYEATVTFAAKRGGFLNGLAVWFKAGLVEDIELSTGPEAPATHWGRTLLPLREAVEVSPGTSIEANVTCTPAGPGWSWTAWWVRVGDGSEQTCIDLRRRPSSASRSRRE